MAHLLPIVADARRVAISVAVGLGLHMPSQAAEAVVPESGRDFVVENWQVEAGLPHNSVTAILQTRDGYLWLGTSNGLARFDGVRFSTFRSLDHPGLASNRILCLYEDQQSVLWAGTEEGGLVRYEKGMFTSVSTAEGLSSSTVLCVGEDRAGGFWVGTDSGLDRASDARRTGFAPVEGVADDPVYALWQPQRAQIVFATRKGLYQLRQERVVPYESAPADLLRSRVFTCVREDGDRCLWVGGDSGLVRLPSPIFPTMSLPSNFPATKVLAVTERTGGRIWFGTSSGQLYSARPKTGDLDLTLVWQFPRPVTALCEDHEGNMWIATAGNGLYRLKLRQLRWVPFADGLSDTRVSSVFETPGGELCLVAANGGLYARRNNEFALLKRLPLHEGVIVQTACATAVDELWLGTRSDGLLRYAGGELRQFSERDGLSDSQVTVLCADGSGGLWIGTRNGGLNHLAGEQVTRFNTPWGFGGTFASALEIDPQGRLWIGTSGDGLYQLTDGQFVAWTKTNGLPSGAIGALYADAEDSLWVGTGGGFCRLREGRVTVFPGLNRLTEEAIVQVRGDAEGNLWVGSGNGLYRFRKDQLNDYADEKARFLDVVPYGKEDGLPTVQCLPLVQSPAWPRRQGGLWFVTAKGLVVNERPGLRWNTVPPPVTVEAVLIENEPVPLSDFIHVPAGKESLQFQYTALSLTAPGKVAFRYQLQGFDRDWSEVTASRSARYPKVTPGSYRFRVIARNNDGVWNETGASVALVVTPFWWATAWFRLALVAVSVLVLGGLYRLRLARQREIERLRIRIATDLHDDVGSSLWSITLLSRMLAQHGSLSTDERQDINEINRISVQTSNSIRDIIWLTNPAFDSLQELALRMKDAAGTMLRGIDYRFKAEGIDLTRKLPPDFRQNLFFLFKEAFTNVAKHAHATEVEVLIEGTASHLRFVIRDNGVGFDPTAPTAGNGVKNLRARAAKIGAVLEIQSDPGQGTTLILTTAKP